MQRFEVRGIDAWLYDDEWVWDTSYFYGYFTTKGKTKHKPLPSILLDIMGSDLEKAGRELRMTEISLQSLTGEPRNHYSQQFTATLRKGGSHNAAL